MVGGLALGAIGIVIVIVIQMIAGVDYPTVPPGLVILVIAACAVALVRRTWMTAIGVDVALFILVGGAFADPGYDNLTDPRIAGAWVGTAVQLLGPAIAVVSGLVIILGGRSSRRTA